MPVAGLGDLGREGNTALSAIAAQSVQLKRLGRDASTLLDALDTGQGQIAALVGNTQRLTNASAGQRRALADSMPALPSVLDGATEASEGLTRLSGALAPVAADLSAAAPALSDASRRLPDGAADLRGLLPALSGTLDRASDTLDRAGRLRDDAAERSFSDELAPLSGVITVEKKSPAQLGGGPIQPLTEGDAAALARPGAAATFGSVTPMRNGIAVARFAEENLSRARVGVVGPKIVEELFGNNPADAVGATIRLGTMPIKVVGVMTSAGDDVVLPINTCRLLIAGADMLNSIGIMAASPAVQQPAISDVNRIMDSRHGISKPAQRDFNTAGTDPLVIGVRKILTRLTMFVLVVAGISLLVGAAGTASLMLMSVAHRTNEIGIRRAVGARRTAIMKQFLIEAMVLAAVGGIMGNALGATLVGLSRELLSNHLGDYVAPELSPRAMLVAFGVSLGIGVLAGCFPALRAARLKPVDALRH